ncbi:hypothetical protein [Leptolyngbya sp. NIES-2104]|uniref:hypothetical protein n=1 Tax=Leptolyngbya sp. NIES-2104 TaxID=1552121 RepID=UPI0006EC9756|nr:hypothetical protein [Leptolyngbya sp. NIES-2104]GAP96577.1 hypothetical protein NIES2104_31200 [Leptolyngbya sp. NIES-2104]
MQGEVHRARIWAAIREAKSFTNEQLQDSLQISYRILQQYVYKLQQLGYLKIVYKHSGWHGHTTYKLVRDTGPIAPSVYQQKDGQLVDDQTRSSKLRVWDALKILQGAAFTLDRVVECSGVSAGVVQQYMLLLRRGSYICRKATGRNSKSLFKLDKYTGPVPPIPCDEGLYDANLRTFVKCYKGSLRGQLDSEVEIRTLSEQNGHYRQHEINADLADEIKAVHDHSTTNGSVNEVASMSSHIVRLHSSSCMDCEGAANVQERNLPVADEELLTSSEANDEHQAYFADNNAPTSVLVPKQPRHQSSLDYQVLALNESLAASKKLAGLLKVLHRSLSRVDEIQKDSDQQEFSTNSSDTTSGACSNIGKNLLLSGDIELVKYLYCLATDLSGKLTTAVNKTTKAKDEN